MEKLIQKFIWNFKSSQRAKTVLKKKNKIGKIHTSLQLPKWRYWNEDGYTEQLNKMKGPEMSPYVYDQLIFKRLPRPSNGGNIQ